MAGENKDLLMPSKNVFLYLSLQVAGETTRNKKYT